MQKDIVRLHNRKLPVISLKTAIVGSGAAGLNAAKRLYDFGQQDIAIITEGLKQGTSRNTGSDKQTYYKLNLSGDKQDSVYDMAETYYQGGAMHGDLARVEAALSVRSFFHLVEIGVPFPHTALGEYVGYKTDHDPGQRATSAGPLTSHYMTEKLEAEVQKRNIKIFDNHQLAGVLVNSQEEQALGLIAIDLAKLKSGEEYYVLFNCHNVIYATGGPAHIYKTSVYPESQTGANGLAFAAGVKGQNLTESQFGLASLKFRWNLSGSYQQVIPRYLSTDQAGNEAREFLHDYFTSPAKLINAIFLKGYQWPFDPGKLDEQGSSLIDLLVYQERVIKNRRVWLDFTRNPAGASTSEGELDFSLLEAEAYDYLKNSEVLFGTPVTRLQEMNQPAYDLYLDNGIDLEKEKLEIAVCAQHNNGGLLGNKWWESNIRNFFPVGEANGGHGVYRPGGSALNSGQVGSLRAAQYIVNCYDESPLKIEDFMKFCRTQIEEKVKFTETIKNNSAGQRPQKIIKEFQELMSREGTIIRAQDSLQDAREKLKETLRNLQQKIKIVRSEDIAAAVKLQDCLITQLVYLKAIEDYISQGGKSRGSYLITSKSGCKPVPGLADLFKYEVSRGEKKDVVQTIKYHNNLSGTNESSDYAQDNTRNNIPDNIPNNTRNNSQDNCKNNNQNYKQNDILNNTRNDRKNDNQDNMRNNIQNENQDNMQINSKNDSNFTIDWQQRRPLKKEKLWFEKEWKKFREGEIYQ